MVASNVLNMNLLLNAASGMERARELSSLNASSPGKVKFAGKLAHRHKNIFREPNNRAQTGPTIFFSLVWKAGIVSSQT